MHKIIRKVLYARNIRGTKEGHPDYGRSMKILKNKGLAVLLPETGSTDPYTLINEVHSFYIHPGAVFYWERDRIGGMHAELIGLDEKILSDIEEIINKTRKEV